MANEKRLIDANALKKAIREEQWVKDRKIQIALEYIGLIIDEQLTVDAVPVVRCKACKHSALYEDGTIFCKLHSEQGEKEERSGSYSVWMEPDDFCSYGERRANV